MGLIYLLKVKCQDKERFLVGQTKQSLSARIRLYKWSLANNKKSNPKLQNCYNKYGWSSFNFSIIEECKNEEMAEKERFYILKFNSFQSDLGLNLTSGGEVGKVLSIESRKRIGDKHRGKIISDAQKVKLRAARVGRKPALGLRHSEVTKIKIAASLGVERFTLLKNGCSFVFLTKSSAAKETGLSRRTITRILKNNKIVNGWSIEK